MGFLGGLGFFIQIYLDISSCHNLVCILGVLFAGLFFLYEYNQTFVVEKLMNVNII